MKRLQTGLACFLAVIMTLGVLLPLARGVRAEGGQPRVFSIPDGVEEIGSEAFFAIKQFDRLYIPRSVKRIADDSFGALSGVSILGHEGTEAQKFAARMGLEFISADISFTGLTAPAWASPFVPVSVSARVESAVDTVSYRYFALDARDESVYMDSGDTPLDEYNFVFERGGDYIIRVMATNGLGTRERTHNITIAQPVMLASDLDEVIIELGESVRIISENENRSVTLTSDLPLVSVSGHNAVGVSPGECTLTAVARTPEGDVYTYIPVNVVVPVTGVEITSPPEILPIGWSHPLSALTSPRDATNPVVSWRVDDDTIATVSEAGLLTGVSQGVTRVYATSGRAEDSFDVRVVKLAEQVIIEPRGDMSGVFMTGQSLAFGARVLPPDADESSVIWSCEPENAATVDDNGVVTGLVAGQAQLIATCADAGQARGVYTLNIAQGPQSIAIDCPDTLSVGETYIAGALVMPLDAADTRVTWSSSDERIMRVDSDGRVTALTDGSAVLRATAINGVYGEITVTCAVVETGIYSALNDIYLTPKVPVCDPYGFMFVQPLNATFTTLTWTSSAPSIVKVDANTGRIEALNVGTAVITATSHFGLQKSITVHAVRDGDVIEGLNISAKYFAMNQGATASTSITYANVPSSLYESGTWFSDNPSVASVSASGARATITARSPGMANIIAVASSGKIAKCEVVVNPRVTNGISLSASEITINQGEQFALEAALLPENSYFDTVTYRSSVPTVAAVSPSGVISALTDGVTVITATTGAGLKATCKVTVNRVINMASAALYKTELTGVIGQTEQLSYAFTPASAHPAAFYWTSDDPGVASVNESTGLLTYLSPGACVITGAACDSSGIRLTANVTVTGTPASAISLGAGDITLAWGETHALSPVVSPEGANYAPIAYSSSDEYVATVDESGTVTAVSQGECVISASTGGVSAEVNVIVTARQDTVYRALIVGEFTSPTQEGFLPFSTNGTTGVKDALRRSRIDGKRYSINYLGSSPTASSIYSAINLIAATADSDDVTVIYILTHGGNRSAYGGYYMQISAPGGGYMNASTLLTRVKGISGHVLLVLCSCSSGYMLQATATKEIMSANGEYMGKFGAGKLSILCSSTDTISSYYDISDTSLSRDFFSYAFLRGLGWDMIADRTLGYMPADANGDGSITVSEIARYSRVNTQAAISAFIQSNGETYFNGHQSQFPTWFIAGGESDLAIYGE